MSFVKAAMDYAIERNQPSIIHIEFARCNQRIRASPCRGCPPAVIEDRLSGDGCCANTPNSLVE